MERSAVQLLCMFAGSQCVGLARLVATGVQLLRDIEDMLSKCQHWEGKTFPLQAP